MAKTEDKQAQYRKTAARWRNDPILFITEVLINPETGKPFDLYPEEETFLRSGLTPGPDGKLPYSELLFSAPKKSGKTGLAAMITLYTIMALGGPFGEAYCIANDLAGCGKTKVFAFDSI